MTIASIDRIFTQGSLQTTGNQTDLAISGDGFFVVSDGDRKFYTRAGNFGLDKNGTLVNPGNGLKVQGWKATRNQAGEMVVNPSGTTEDIVVPIYGKVDARETANIRYKCNLDSRYAIVPPNATGQQRASAASPPTSTPMTARGTRTGSPWYFWKTGPNQWTASAAITERRSRSPLTCRPARASRTTRTRRAG